LGDTEVAWDGLNPFRGGEMATKDGKSKRPARVKAGTSPDNVVSLGRDIQVKIGQHLRTMYDEVVKQGVPDHLNELLQRLDESNKGAEKDRHK
jgi:hypothetical protein